MKYGDHPALTAAPLLAFREMMRQCKARSGDVSDIYLDQLQRMAFDAGQSRAERSALHQMDLARLGGMEAVRALIDLSEPFPAETAAEYRSRLLSAQACLMKANAP